MAVDKLVDSSLLDSDLEDIADAIRAKGGTSAALAFPAGFISAIENLPGGGGTETIIVPEQTITVSSNYTPIQFNDPLVVGEEFIATVNGVTKTLTCVSQYGSLLLNFGDGLTFDYAAPSMYFDVSGSALYGTYTIKVVQQSGGGAILINKNITANGTYNASDDNADGYSSVNVAVPSKLVTGTFIGSTTGAAMDVSIPYSGSGYPIAGIIYPSSGGNSGSIASLAQQYAMIMYSFCKSDMSSTPTFSGDTSENKAVITSLYKYSNSDPTSSTAGRLLTQQFYHNANATATATACVKVRSSTSMSVYIANTSYGFKEGIEYTYQLIYSS